MRRRKRIVRWSAGVLLVLLTGFLLLIESGNYSPEAVMSEGDSAALTAALVDFMNHESLESLNFGAQSPAEFKVALEPSNPYMQEVPVPARLLRHLRKRNEISIDLSEFVPASKTIIVTELKQPNMARRESWVECFLPGYSWDGQLAVVVFFFGPRAHAALGIYVLQKTGNSWTVVKRSLIHFA